MLLTEPSLLAMQAQTAASDAAERAGVRVVDEFELDRLRDVANLLVAVWGTSKDGAPIPADLLRSFTHAGCNVTAAYDVSGVLLGAAVAIIAEGSSTYSLIAGVLRGFADRGVGFALKQHQRAWALHRGFTAMTWTFDPLVSRNARFNLTKLGAQAGEYRPNFYGFMDDAINANGESDRLVAVWQLDSDRAASCSIGQPVSLATPTFGPGEIRAVGPDGQPALAEADGALWCRVPSDIVLLRGRDAAQAEEWRASTRQIFTEAFASGHTADGVTRAGWYHLEPEGRQ
jgi:predicted GNAT superfamily acetyltransferase